MEDASSKYRDFLAGGLNQSSSFEALQNKIFLGDDTFVEISGIT